METVNMHQAKAQLSKLIDRAVKGEPFIIAKAGRPLVKVIALDPPPAKPMKRIGMLESQFTVPDNFKQIGADEIDEMVALMEADT